MLALFALVALGAAAAPDPRPAVVVYPLQASAALPRDVALRIVTTLSNEIAVDGRVRAIPADPDTDRSAYLAAARKLGADFYVTGFLTPLGDGASLIVQLVSTQSGAVVFSSSAQISSLSDVSSQGDILRLAIIGHANPGYPALTNSSAGANATPPPPAASEAPEANIGGLFRHKKAEPKPTPTATPSVTPAPVASASP
jgi:hypothetical protein